MTCTRHYSPATVADLQQIAASIEAERRRQYRAEMAQELRVLFRERQGRVNYPGRGQMAQGIDAGLELAIDIIDTLAAPVVCDSNE